MNVEEVNLSSVKLSDLPVLSSLADNSYIVVENGASSFKVPYSKFRQSMMSQLDQVMQLGTMSQHDLEEYSKFAHGHDYTDFYFFPSYGPQSNNAKYKDESTCIKCGTFSIVKHLPGSNKKRVH